MTNQPVCRVCGQPLTAHTLSFWYGVASTECAATAADREYFLGEAGRIKRIIRSLRQRAGRLGPDMQQAGETLDGYADVLEKERRRLIKMIAKHFAWGERSL